MPGLTHHSASDYQAYVHAADPPQSEAVALRTIRIGLLFPESLTARLWMSGIHAATRRNRHMGSLRRIIRRVERLFPRV